MLSTQLIVCLLFIITIIFLKNTFNFIFPGRAHSPSKRPTFAHISVFLHELSPFNSRAAPPVGANEW